MFIDEARKKPESSIARKVLQTRTQKERERLVKGIEIELAWLTREIPTSFIAGQKVAYLKVLRIIKKGV